MKNIQREPWVTKYGYASNPTFMLENDENKKRRKWVYTRQKYEERYGFINGKTTIKEITEVVKKQHYDKGKPYIFNDKCENIAEEKVVEGKRAPWMEVAIKVAKDMKGCVESKEPMYSNAKKYLRYCGNSFEPTDGENGPWCAAFMNWCINQTINPLTKKSYKHAKSAASLAPIDAVAGKNYKKINEPVYGCIVVYKHKTKWKGHTGFLYGKTKVGEYILIGGNQENTVRLDSYGEYTSSSKLKKLYGFYVPNDYVVTDEDKLKSTDTYDSADTLNIKYGIIAGKSTGKTN